MIFLVAYKAGKDNTPIWWLEKSKTHANLEMKAKNLETQGFVTGIFEMNEIPDLH